MKTTFRIATIALSFAAAGAAFAGGDEYVDATANVPQVSTLTRADVQTALKRAVAEGSIVVSNAAPDGSIRDATRATVAARSRADVRTESTGDRATHFALSSEKNSL